MQKYQCLEMRIRDPGPCMEGNWVAVRGEENLTENMKSDFTFLSFLNLSVEIFSSVLENSRPFWCLNRAPAPFSLFSF